MTAISFFAGLAQRDLQPELMDQPDLSNVRHQQALAGLARINTISGSSRIVWRPIRKLAERAELSEISVLDVACGSGDVDVRLWRRARNAGLRLNITGCDISGCAIDEAVVRARRAAADVKFEVRDIFAPVVDDADRTEPGRRYDVVTSSLFLHHQSEQGAVDLLRRMSQLARRLVVVNDLVRGPMGYAAARVVTRLVTRSDVVRYDGPQSVAAAFRIDEVRDLAERAGLHGAVIRKAWPFRFVLTWEPS